MNYFFVHLGQYPYWLTDSINSVKKSDPESNIFLCGDSEQKINHALNINLNNIISDNTRLAMNSSLWKNDPNPLWKTSLYRIFILIDMMNHFNVSEFVHFDSDVILFESFQQIKKEINTSLKGLHITPCNNNEVVFGYSYCNSKESLVQICEYTLKAMFDMHFLKYIIKDHPNEMQILSGIQKLDQSLIYDLPTLPNLNNEYIFDPSSYGQYLYGTHAGDPPGWSGDHHRIGKLINSGNLQIDMNKTPLAILNGVQSKIANLHIHSKKTWGINV